MRYDTSSCHVAMLPPRRFVTKPECQKLHGGTTPLPYDAVAILLLVVAFSVLTFSVTSVRPGHVS